jgi:hypothetical protein
MVLVFNCSSCNLSRFLFVVRKLAPIIDGTPEFQTLAGGWISILFDLTRPAEIVELKGKSFVSVDVGVGHNRVAPARVVSVEVVAHGFGLVVGGL